MTAQTEADVASLSYEEARDELVQVVNRLEQGGATLEESLQLWERGEALAARCEEWLLGARKRACGIEQRADLADPLVNLTCARRLYEASGWSPWGGEPSKCRNLDTGRYRGCRRRR